MNKPLGLKEAAEQVGMSRDTLRRAIQRGELPALLTTGKTGPQFHVEPEELRLWMERRTTTYSQVQEESGQAQQATHEGAQAQHDPGDVLLDQRLALLEESHRDHSLALVRLAMHQDLVESVQRWRDRADASKAKVRKLRKQLAEVSELEQENHKRQQLWEAEKAQLLGELRTHKERVNWLEKRVPRWVRGLFGAR